MDDSQTTLTQALEAKDYAKAKEIMLQTFAEPLTKQEQGAIIAGAFSAYVKSANEINEDYIKALQDSVDLLKQVVSTTKKIETAEKIQSVRNSLK